MYGLGLADSRSFLACSPDMHRSVKFPGAFLLAVQYRRHYLATAEILLFCCRGSAMYVMSIVCVLKRVSRFPSYAVRLQLTAKSYFFLRFPSRDPFATSNFLYLVFSYKFQMLFLGHLNLNKHSSHSPNLLPLAVPHPPLRCPSQSFPAALPVNPLCCLSSPQLFQSLFSLFPSPVSRPSPSFFLLSFLFLFSFSEWL